MLELVLEEDDYLFITTFKELQDKIKYYHKTFDLSKYYECENIYLYVKDDGTLIKFNLVNNHFKLELIKKGNLVGDSIEFLEDENDEGSMFVYGFEIKAESLEKIFILDSHFNILEPKTRELVAEDLIIIENLANEMGIFE